MEWRLQPQGDCLKTWSNRRFAQARSVAVLFAQILVLSTVIADAAVFGDDNRTRLPTHLSQLANSVGLVTSDTERTLCTAFCVGRRTIATAAHCLFRTAGERRPDLGSFRFVVGSRAARKISVITGEATGAQRQHVIAGASSLKVTPPIDATRDWALMRLAQPVCQGQSLTVDKISPVRVNRLAARGRLLNVAFHGDLRNWQLAVSRTCATKTDLTKPVRKQIARDFSDTSALVLHECDTGLASSGSPLLALNSANRLKVVAINVGTYQQTRYLVTGDSVTRRYKPATVANTAVSGSAFADHILAFTRADILSDRNQVRQLQVTLNRAGFDAGSADGLYGERTRSATIAFEGATGRAPIGLATRQLLYAVRHYRKGRR
ncbi:MAG: V8-like Glu-specific endopeptidase [Hyphomicrobiaceae bacterium]|jgi:V8-like Glu-specific endopeptidase